MIILLLTLAVIVSSNHLRIFSITNFLNSLSKDSVDNNLDSIYC